MFHMDSMEQSIWILLEESTSNSVEKPPIVLSKIVSTLRIEQSTPQHVTCMGDSALLLLNHMTVIRHHTALS